MDRREGALVDVTQSIIDMRQAFLALQGYILSEMSEELLSIVKKTGIDA